MCATMVAPALAGMDVSGSTTLSLYGVDISKLNGNGTYGEDDLKATPYTSADITGEVVMNEHTVNIYYEPDGGSFLMKSCGLTEEWNGNTFVGTFSKNISDAVSIMGLEVYLSLALHPTEFNNLVVGDYDYSDATVSINLYTEDFSESEGVWTTTLRNDSVSVSGAKLATPEPATATLSLLALAGLAARRRRLR